MAYFFKKIPNHEAKERLLAHFFKGCDGVHFQKVASQYSLKRIPEILRKEAVDRLHWHQQQGDIVVVVSASMSCWLEPWCLQNNMDLIATRLEIKEEKVSGKFSTKNCYGAEKEARIRAKYDLGEFEKVYAYGDSKGDAQMLALADLSFYKSFTK